MMSRAFLRGCLSVHDARRQQARHRIFPKKTRRASLPEPAAPVRWRVKRKSKMKSKSKKRIRSTIKRKRKIGSGD
jgi:hypothetical protein